MSGFVSQRSMVRDKRLVSEDNERRLAEPGNDLLCLRVIHFCSSGGFHRDLDIFVTNSFFLRQS